MPQAERKKCIDELLACVELADRSPEMVQKFSGVRESWPYML